MVNELKQHLILMCCHTDYPVGEAKKVIKEMEEKEKELNEFDFYRWLFEQSNKIDPLNGCLLEEPRAMLAEVTLFVLAMVKKVR